MATSTLGSGTLVLAGTTSGTTTVTATAVAGTTTLTLPAATDTLVGKATTDTLTNKTLTGAAMNGTLGATTPSTVAATTLTTSSTVTHNGGTANGVAYLDGSKVLTTGSALVFDGTNLLVGTTTASANFYVYNAPVSYAGLNATAIFSSSASQSTGTGGLIAFEGKYTSGGALANFAAIGGLKENSTDSNYSGYLGFYTRLNGSLAAERARIDSSGNLLVGGTGLEAAERLNVRRGSITTSPLTVNVVNTAATTTTRNASALMRIASNASGADTCIQFTDSVANNYWFGGNNGGAYVVANSNGVRLSNGGTSWASDSDERIKTAIVPFENAIEKVCTLRSGTGRYLTDDESVSRSFLIAQDVQAVLPEAVVIQDDEIGTLSLAYTDVIPLLVKAIQELKAEIDSLKSQLNGA